MRRRAVRRAIKRFVPSNLFGRALLIVLIPLVVLQLLVAHVFFERHWDSVVRTLSGSTAGDIAVVDRAYSELGTLEGSAAALRHARSMGDMLGIVISYSDHPDAPVIAGHGKRKFPEFYTDLSERIGHPFMVDDDRRAGRVLVRVDHSGAVLGFDFDRKRLTSPTTSIFILWMMGAAVLLMLIATIFLRNQIKPIVQLARAAEQFGLGQERVEFTTRGASEIKRAASAFRTMADRIRRSVTSRTEMLAGISHDLRTPLTRMKLEIEMGKMDQATRDALGAEIEEMRSMIDEYLDFAKGDAGEPMEPLDIGLLLSDLVEAYRRQRRAVTLGRCDSAILMMKPQAMRRSLTNLIDNALRYGRTAHVECEQTLAFVRIKIADSGPGIPEEEQETVFKPFTRLEASRNIKTGGVGLGLSIARDIAQSHGGNVTLMNQRDGSGNITGLEVTLRLPREVNS